MRMRAYEREGGREGGGEILKPLSAGCKSTTLIAYSSRSIVCLYSSTERGDKLT